MTAWLLDRKRPMDARAMAAHGLVVLARTHRVESREVETAAVNALIAALDDPWELVQRNAILGLREWGDPHAIPALERMMAATPDERGVRLARQTILRLKRGRHAGQETQKLRGDLEEMREENRKLRARLEALEARMGSANGAASASGGAGQTAASPDAPPSGNDQGR